jgi:glycosyltransferase involved in cell wall biosynthesis
MPDKKLIVGINAVALLSPLTGIGHYVKNLIEEFDKLPNLKIWKFYGSHWGEQLREEGLPAAVTRWKEIARQWIPNAYSLSRAFQQQRFSTGSKSIKPDVYHEPNFLAYEFDGPSVITVHDLSWIRYPHTHPRERVRAMDKYFEPGLRRATRILTDSHFVKSELVDLFGVPADRVEPVHLGADKRFRPMEPHQTAQCLYDFGLEHGRYLLAVGTLEPRKNLKAALEAFMRLPQSVRRHNPLVLVGAKGWHVDHLASDLDRLVAAREVRYLGYLSRQQLIVVTAGARALIYPSVYEGFGLPPLEAMACGVPVVASGVSSIPEVVGSGGILVSPEDIDGMKDALRRLVEDPVFHQRMSGLALEQSSSFSWSRCASETQEVYRRAVAGS